MLPGSPKSPLSQHMATVFAMAKATQRWEAPSVTQSCASHSFLSKTGQEQEGWQLDFTCSQRPPFPHDIFLLATASETTFSELFISLLITKEPPKMFQAQVWECISTYHKHYFISG